MSADTRNASPTHMIRLDDVMRRYSDEVTIGPVNLSIPRGGITALVGPNGAGKSTLLTMIGRLMQADGGSITVDGLDVSRTPSKRMAKVVSILRQENHFVTRLTVRQLVGFGRFPYSKGHLTAVDEDKVSEAIDFMGLSELESRYLDQLSGGQRQRAYVAMVLAQDTECILLDEPLNNLDMEHSAAMMRRLDTFVKEQGKTVVIVLHDINFAARYASHICAMKNGQVAHFGTAEEVMDPEVLTEVFNTQVDVVSTERGRIAVYY